MKCFFSDRLLEDMDNNIVYYVLLRALDQFHETHKRFPGVFVEDVDSDVGHVRKSVNTVLASWQISPTCVSDEYIQQM
jgi:amyloid beta precursor protein binding protein 1